MGTAAPRGQGDASGGRRVSLSSPRCPSPLSPAPVALAFPVAAVAELLRAPVQPGLASPGVRQPSDGDKQLPLASPRRGEAKGSAAHAASPSSGAVSGSRWRQAKGERGRMGGCRAPHPGKATVRRGLLPG